MATWGPYLQLLSIDLAATGKSKLSPGAEYVPVQMLLKPGSLPLGWDLRPKIRYLKSLEQAHSLPGHIKRRYKPNRGGGSTPFKVQIYIFEPQLPLTPGPRDSQQK